LNTALTKISGSWQRLTFGGWILMAFLLIGYNSSKLAVILSPPITGRSMEVKLASQKWRQLQDKLSRDSRENKEEIDLDLVLLGISKPTENHKPELKNISSAELDSGQQTKIQLPILSGILHNTDVHGRVSSRAIIDGQRLKESDKIQGFKIQEIADDGVAVTRNGQRWFLRAPNVPYSRIHVSGVESDGSNASIPEQK
jgi:hypothetical protein